jgi:hypothetical protein
MTFSERMQGLMTKGIAASKDILSKAGAQAQVWGEMGALKVEILQLRSQAEKLTAQLGAEAYAAFVERGEADLSAASPRIAALLERIRDVSRAIDDNEARYKKVGGKESDLDQDAESR